MFSKYTSELHPRGTSAKGAFPLPCAPSALKHHSLTLNRVSLPATPPGPLFSRKNKKSFCLSKTVPSYPVWHDFCCCIIHRIIPKTTKQHQRSTPPSVNPMQAAPIIGTCSNLPCIPLSKHGVPARTRSRGESGAPEYFNESGA